MLTLRVMSRPGRVTKPGQIYTIVRNVLGEPAVKGIGRVRLLPQAKDSADDQEVSISSQLYASIISQRLRAA